MSTTTTYRPIDESEVQKNRAEAKAAESLADKYQQESAKAAAEASAVTVARDYAEISLRQALRAEKAELARDESNHVYNFDGPVTGASVTSCMRRLTEWSRNDATCEIELVFHSPGGSVIDGMALWDFLNGLRAKGHKITTVCLGMAASMAGILLQAGDVRVIGRESYILVHEVSFGAGGKIGEVEDEVAFVKKIQDRVLDIFAKRTTLTKKQLAVRWRRKDWWLDSKEAVALGFVDEVR